jgi:hypothetical protein
MRGISVVNTPPPSTTSNTTSGYVPSGAGTGGVQAPDGYKADTGQMSSAGRNIGNKAEDAKGEVDEIKPAKVKAAEFGKHEEHQAWHPDYSAAIEQLAAGATAMCDNLIAFAGNLGGAGATYDAQESAAQSNVSQSGANL